MFHRFINTDGHEVLIDLSTICLVIDRIDHRVINTPFDEIQVLSSLGYIEKLLAKHKRLTAIGRQN